MNYLKISFGIFVALAASRFIPHPPNFTSLLALSFYVPALLGVRYLPVLIFSFVVTDIFIGFHSVVFFTWGSVILVGLSSKFFKKNILNRVLGSLLGACLFFIITNFGVWSLGSYGYNLNGFIACYTLALPFFAYSLTSTFIFSGFIEGFYKLNFLKLKTTK
ncbi:hypothetical protein OAD70_01615 [Candidatus Pelagibacter sp.]|nr:hypothetical protein [Candidatus Pelagibacter sp.]|tara:strand:+ start:1729 stop:2214 length:486 start_codon:yes stop_codon:yes gene_type:complete